MIGRHKVKGPVKRIYCKYCGKRLRRDTIGQYCSTKGCRWANGLPKHEDTKTER